MKTLPSVIQNTWLHVGTAESVFDYSSKCQKKESTRMGLWGTPEGSCPSRRRKPRKPQLLQKEETRFCKLGKQKACEFLQSPLSLGLLQRGASVLPSTVSNKTGDQNLGNKQPNKDGLRVRGFLCVQQPTLIIIVVNTF